MATYYLSPISTVLQAFTNQGVILAGGSITTYTAGTTTPTSTWTDITGGVLNSNPMTLDSAGRPTSMIWQQSRVPIKAIFKDASGVQVGPTYDQLSGIGDPGSSLQSFYGTDSGAANAYVITVANANFSSYVDGLVIYWSPTHTNTTASTVNVNGLGAVALKYPNGSALGAGAIVSGGTVQMLSAGGIFVVLSSSGASGTISTGTVTLTAVGGTTSPTVTARWTRSGYNVTMVVPSVTFTSNSTGFSLSGVPSALWIAIGDPSALSGGFFATDNSVSTYGAGDAFLAANSGSITLEYKGGLWTNAGTKSFGNFTLSWAAGANFG